MLKFCQRMTALAACIAHYTGYAAVLTYDTAYDDASGSLANVACSDGPHGFLTKGYTTYGSLPTFPYIGAASAIAQYDSPSCGTCWQLTFTDAAGRNKSVNVLAIDHASPGYNIAFKAMDELIGGQAAHLGKIDVAAKQLNSSVCGM